MQTEAPAQVPTSANTGSARQIDSTAAIAILNRRTTVTPAHVGSSLRLAIQGTGQFLPKGHKYVLGTEARENLFDRTIYNLKASSSLLMAYHKPLFTAAMKAESVGEVGKAHDLFNEYLNSVQLSFSVIESSSRKFNSGDDVKAHVQMVTSNGGQQSLQVDSVSYIAPTVVAQTKFSVEDLIEAEAV